MQKVISFQILPDFKKEGDLFVYIHSELNKYIEGYRIISTSMCILPTKYYLVTYVLEEI